MAIHYGISDSPRCGHCSGRQCPSAHLPDSHLGMRLEIADPELHKRRRCLQERAMKRIVAGVLEVAYLEAGPSDGAPVILLHGFPYDVHAYDAVAELLAASGRRCIIPFLRGYGSTRFLSAQTPRSGQQAALGADLLALMDALAIRSAVLAGYDWGGRAACIVAALWPERARGLVSSGNGYNIQNIAKAAYSPCAGGRAPLLVSVLLPLGTRPRRSHRQSARAMPAALAAVVADMGFRRRHIRAQRRRLRQPGFRGRGHPFLPPSLRRHSRRPDLGRHRGPPGAGARHRRAEHRAARRRRRRRSARQRSTTTLAISRGLTKSG